MQILHISAECFPVAKVGGLADVVGALPKYQQSSGVHSSVIMPFYDSKFTQTNKEKFSITTEGTVSIGDVLFNYQILKLEKEVLGFKLQLVKIMGLTDRELVYGYEDDVERFVAFQKVTCDFIKGLESRPNIIHCHDHHTGFIPFFTSKCHTYNSLKNIPTILTIHNAQYQGDFNYDKMHYLPEFDLSDAGLIDWYGRINPLATAIKCAWKITTVSPTYLGELQQVANGLEGLLRNEKNKSIGILNGVDIEVWNPKKDPMLVSNFDLRSINKGREGNKHELCKRFNFNPSLPLIAFIGRFVHEKGSDLLAETIYNVLEVHKMNVSILVLGSGNSDTENQLTELKSKLPNNFNTYIGYSEELSHVIYGGADFLLMPSRVEPCGLNQMYAMRYGMLPIVSKVGGLKDTVIDIDKGDEGYGIVINDVNVHEMSFAIQRAIDVYKNTRFFKEKRKQLMKIENSWNNSAIEYLKMYKSILQLTKK